MNRRRSHKAAGKGTRGAREVRGRSRGSAIGRGRCYLYHCIAEYQVEQPDVILAELLW